MKKFFYVTLMLISLFAVSCSEDFTDPKELSGTVWRCSDFGAHRYAEILDYYELRFTSSTKYEEWDKFKNEDLEKAGEGTYTIKDNILTATMDGESETFTIDKKTMSLTVDGVKIVFKKQ